MRHGSTRRPASAWWARGVLVVLTLAAGNLTTPSAARGGDSYLGEDRLGTRTAPLLLLTRPDVQAELKLSPDQVESAFRTIRELHERANSLRGQPDTPEVIASRRAIDQAQTEWIQTQLSVDQQTRLVQIDLQWEGPAALLTRPALADTLGLTAAQRRTLAEAINARQQRRQQGQTDREDELPLAETALATLDEQQLARWKSLLGPPFAVQPDRTRDAAVQPASRR